MSREHPHYKLTYYNARGVAEPIRLIFALNGIEYEDNRLPLEEVSFEYITQLKARYTSLPVLEIDGVPYYNSLAIFNYLAKKYNLCGSTDLEEFRMQECFERFRMWFIKWRPILYNALPEKRREALKQRLLAVDTPAIMNYYHDMLIQNNEMGSPWMFGDRMTLLDILTSHFLWNFKASPSLGVDLFEEYPAFQDLQEEVFAQPGIKEWIEKRPDSVF